MLIAIWANQENAIPLFLSTAPDIDTIDQKGISTDILDILDELLDTGEPD